MLGPSSKKSNSGDIDPLPLHLCLAKTRRPLDPFSGTVGPKLLAGRTVEEHCRIVGAVAQILLLRMAKAQRLLFPEHAYRVALVHDVGKICPTFQEKLYRAIGVSPNSLPELRDADPKLEHRWGGHAAVSLATLHACHAAPFVAGIAGQHHGRVSIEKPHDYSAFGGITWHQRRRELLCRLLPQDPESPEVWPQVHNWEQARLLAGLTIVADWIGSGSCFDDPEQPWDGVLPARGRVSGATAETRVESAVSEAGFFPLYIRQDLKFDDIFGFQPRDAQTRFYESVSGPGVYVLEAPMGEGKTEAALYAAYTMLQRGLSSGIYFALPTQLTSNRIHARLDEFLTKILDDASQQHAHLLHGNAWLAHFLQQEMGEDAAPAGSWFQAGKRGILAPFAAGTVDQALMAVMNVRHGAVRAFGLAGKTVILDEVHSYDAYTGVILDALVNLLRHYGCTVIILSATLTAERRASFTGQTVVQSAYPLVSVSHAWGQCEEIICPPPDAAEVIVHHISDDDGVCADALAFDEALRRAEEGQQVLWIENTVAEAQACFQLFAARASELGLEVGLVHSRFTQADRHANESHWTALYGKNASERSQTGRILVGTQVLEQSLDIDADFLVTRFCPTDMLLQRMGRLWRHSTTERPPTARREAWLLHPSLQSVMADPSKIWKSTGYVYMPYVLFRSLEVWAQRPSVTLPLEIRSLLEATYQERAELDPGIAAILQEVKKERESLRGLALHGVSTGVETLSDEHPKTRAGHLPDAQVLLLRAIDAENGTVTLADGSVLCLAASSDCSWYARQEAAARLTMNMVRVPERLAPHALNAREMNWLTPWIYCIDSHTGEACLRVAMIRPDDTLADLNGSQVGAKTRYRRDYGYFDI